VRIDGVEPGVDLGDAASSTVSIRLRSVAGASWLVMPTRQRAGTSMLPPSVSSAPVTSFSSVVLPVPLRPTRPTLWPSLTVTEARSNRSRGPTR
jgi:hypothetical protein